MSLTKRRAKQIDRSYSISGHTTGPLLKETMNKAIETLGERWR